MPDRRPRPRRDRRPRRRALSAAADPVLVPYGCRWLRHAGLTGTLAAEHIPTDEEPDRATRSRRRPPESAPGSPAWSVEAHACAAVARIQCRSAGADQQADIFAAAVSDGRAATVLRRRLRIG